MKQKFEQREVETNEVSVAATPAPDPVKETREKGKAGRPKTAVPKESCTIRMTVSTHSELKSFYDENVTNFSDGIIASALYVKSLIKRGKITMQEGHIIER